VRRGTMPTPRPQRRVRHPGGQQRFARPGQTFDLNQHRHHPSRVRPAVDARLETSHEPRQLVPQRFKQPVHIHNHHPRSEHLFESTHRNVASVTPSTHIPRVERAEEVISIGGPGGRRKWLRTLAGLRTMVDNEQAATVVV
jgi:hypothetical protein